MEFKNDYVLGFIICEIFTVITLQDWVGWGISTVIPGYPRRANSDSQHSEARPELQDWLRFELPLEQKSLHTHNFYCWGIIFAITHTHQLHNFNCQGINLCNACVSLVSVCLASIISQKGNYTTIMSRGINIQLH